MQSKLLSLACGAIGSVIAFFLIFLFFTPKLSVNAVNLACEGNCASADTIRVAMELGRLDIVALVLTFLGLLMAVLAIFGFVAVREKAALQAKDAAREATEKWLNEEGPNFMASQFRTLNDIYGSEVPMKDADNYAGMWDETTNDQEDERDE